MFVQDNEASVSNIEDPKTINRIQGHTVGCWTKCNANYINNNLKSRMKLLKSERCDPEYTFDNYKDAIKKCEEIVEKEFEFDITRIKNIKNKMKQKLEIERKIRGKTQCAIFKFPPKPGYEFRLDEDKKIIRAGDFLKQEN